MKFGCSWSHRSSTILCTFYSLSVSSAREHFWVSSWTLLSVNTPNILESSFSHRRLNPGTGQRLRSKQTWFWGALGSTARSSIIQKRIKLCTHFKAANCNHGQKSGSFRGKQPASFFLSQIIIRSLIYPTVLTAFIFISYHGLKMLLCWSSKCPGKGNKSDVVKHHLLWRTQKLSKMCDFTKFTGKPWVIFLQYLENHWSRQYLPILLRPSNFKLDSHVPFTSDLHIM